ncbi:MAG: hypothetical protein GY822_29550 [Deltaproteobacteria bacterium]|nr:hypothetical protein [Deltaproteobacteria bacterium]
MKKKDLRTIFGFVAVFLASSSNARARSDFRFEVPNGTAAQCLTCHTSSGDGASWNDFG